MLTLHRSDRMLKIINYHKKLASSPGSAHVGTRSIDDRLPVLARLKHDDVFHGARLRTMPGRGVGVIERLVAVKINHLSPAGLGLDDDPPLPVQSADGS